MNGLATLPRRKLVAVLSRLESPFDGERAAAALLAARMVRDAGLSWENLIASAESVDWRRTVDACRARLELLTRWEVSFLAVLASYTGEPSVRQLEALQGIADRVL